MKETACYIHIPFCEHKCIYCDFYSIIKFENQNSFISSLLSEIRNSSKLYSDSRIIKTIYFGGGTPSLLKPQQIEQIINEIKNGFVVDTKSEITLEVNPGTVDKLKISEFKSAGINRVSIGVQSFHEDDLKFLTRIHNKQKAIETIQICNAIGFDSISLDLIFNLPGQNLKRWKENLDIAVKLPIDHISAYSLILERGTILNKMVLDKKIKIQGEEIDASLYEMTIDLLSSNGFQQYEVSNFCKNNKQSKHNLFYWLYKDYLGFGPSAHSFTKNNRWWNYSSLKQYINSIKFEGFAVRGKEILSKNQMIDEFIMLALRSTGLNVNLMKTKFGKDWFDSKSKKLAEFVDAGLLFENNQTYICTKKGYIFCDELIKQLL